MWILAAMEVKWLLHLTKNNSIRCSKINSTHINLMIKRTLEEISTITIATAIRIPTLLKAKTNTKHREMML